MKLHLVALPHTRVEPAFCGCAYTTKILKFCKMMQGVAEIILYAPELSDDSPWIKGAEVVPCLSDKERIKIFGPDDPARLPAWPTAEQSHLFNLRAAAAIKERADARDLVLLSGGLTNKVIHDALPAMLHVEPFVGYEGIMTERCAFESFAWMHTVYAQRGIKDLRWFDAVIPPYVDPDDFPLMNDGNGNGKYLLFLGRMISRKGPHIAAEIAKAAGLPLVLAGAGGRQVTESEVVGMDVKIEGDVRYVGPVGVVHRNELMAKAAAVLMPTTYIEPGGNVALEAMMSGTPVITPDCGVFSETVPEQFRFHSFREAVGCVAIARGSIFAGDWLRGRTADDWSLDAVRPKYERWFAQLQTLFGKGWYEYEQAGMV